MKDFKKNRVKHILIMGIIFLFLTGLRFLWLAYHTPPDQPLIHEGTLDLRNYELVDEQTVRLNGEWAFYPETFLDPYSQDLDSTSNKGMMISVPSVKSKNFSYQFGTYRLRILLGNNEIGDNRYAIRIPSAKTASALFIDGNLVGSSGEVSANRSQHIGKDIPYVAFFKANQEEIDIIVHVSNFDTPESVVIGKSIEFGSAASIVAAQSYTTALIIGMVVVLLIHSLYTILIYIFIYREKIVLFFTAGFLFPALDELITYNKAVLDWLHLDYDWSLKLINLIYLGASFFFVQFMRVLLTNYRYATRFRWFTILYGLSALLIVLMPVHYLVPANTLFFVLYFLSFVSVVILALKEYVQNQKESFFLAFAALSTTSGILWGVIKASAAIDIPFYPFDYLFALLAFASFWFMRFYRKETRIVELVGELQKADKLKDEFLTNSSQKLWSPLNNMITIAESISDGERGSSVTQDKENLKYLISVGRSMSFVLNDLLDFTRLKEGTIHLHRKSTDIQAAVSGVFDMLRFITDGKDIQMTSTIPKSFPNVFADENRLIQILFNLLHNAIKYTDVGFISVHSLVGNGMATIHIRDSGLGMDEETQKRIFSPYEQKIEDDEGIGLGLSVCKKLIELHGGTLQIQSVPNQGSDFFFTLPLAEGQLDEEEELEVNLNAEPDATWSNNQAKPPEEWIQGKRFNILAIDDDPVNLKVISNIFTSEEYRVMTVTSGKEGLVLLEKIDWDLIILDTMMPYMSGYEFMRLVRERYSILDLPILLLNARNSPEDVYMGFTLGANDYVSKPINSLELKFRAKGLISLKHSISEHLYLEAAWLQAQIQPHFLFNTLNSIASLSTIDSNRMVILLNNFGEYLRRSFDVKNLQRIVSLEDELELVRSYLYIEQERFRDRLQVKWEVTENIAIELPPISIQPLVENAVRHGVLKKTSGGTVCIRITNHLEFIKIAIIDDGVGMDEQQLSQVLDKENTLNRGIGLLNTDRRLKKIYGQGLKINSEVNKGTEVIFKIPKVGQGL